MADPALIYPDAKLVLVRSFRDVFEAQMAKVNLDGADIRILFLADENTVRINWSLSNAIGGVKLLVRDTDIADALTVLNQPIPESFEVDGVGEYMQPRCPQCGSLDVNFGNQPLVYGSLFDSNPVRYLYRVGIVQKCSHTWEIHWTTEFGTIRAKSYFCFFSIFAHPSFKATVRLKTGLSGF